MTWVRVGYLVNVPRRGARVVQTSGGPIAVFRDARDRVFALDDRCPHRGGPLSQGIVHGCQVTCPLHGLALRLDDGRAVAPDVGEVRCHRVRLEDGVIWVQLDDGVAATEGAAS